MSLSTVWLVKRKTDNIPGFLLSLLHEMKICWVSSVGLIPQGTNEWPSTLHDGCQGRNKFFSLFFPFLKVSRVTEGRVEPKNNSDDDDVHEGGWGRVKALLMSIVSGLLLLAPVTKGLREFCGGGLRQTGRCLFFLLQTEW